jgi:hypothetical protein
MPYVEYDEVVASCSECGRSFRSEEDLETHRGEVHEAPAKAAALTSAHSARPKADAPPAPRRPGRAPGT